MEGGSLGCSKCRYAKKGCGRCRDLEFQERQRSRESRKRHVDGAWDTKGAERAHQDKKRRKVGAEAVPQQEVAEDTLDARGAAASQGGAGKGRGLQRSSSSSRRLQRSGSSSRKRRGSQYEEGGPRLQHCSSDAAKPAAPSQHARQGTAAVAPRNQPAGDSTASEEAPEQFGSGLEMGIAAGMLPLPEGALHAEGTASHARLLRRRSSGRNKAAAPETLQHMPEQADRMQGSGEAAAGGAEAPQAAAEAGSPGGAPGVGPAKPDLAAADYAEAEQRRRASFMELLRSNMAARQEQRRAGCGALSGPSLAAALAAGAKQKKKGKQREVAAGDPRVSMWEPPQSPYSLIEEELFGNPWRLLVACILLNKTSIVQVRKVIWKLFELMPTPEAAVAADVNEIRRVIEPLGLIKRAPMLQRFSQEYMEKQWTRPEQLHGIGQYGADAYDIFCRGDWRSVAPKDKDLLRYHRWLLDTEGLGSGLVRDAAPDLAHGGAGESSV